MKDLSLSSALSPSLSLIGESTKVLWTSSISGVSGGLAIGSLGILNDISRSIISTNRSRVRRGVASLWFISSVRLSLSSNLIIQSIETLGFSAVKVEPPVTDEVVLVEDGSVGAEEAVLGKTSSTISSADVEHLALGFWISIVSSINLSITRKSGFWDLGIDWIIFSGYSRNSFL